MAESYVFRCGGLLALLAGLSATAATQTPAAPAAPRYTIAARDGAAADIPFARRWLDAAEQLMAAKYHVVPARYQISVNLLARPENDIDITQSGQNRCCASDADGRKTGDDFFAGALGIDLG